MPERFRKLDPDEIKRIQSANPHTADLVKLVSQRLLTGCFPVAVYSIARSFDNELWDIQKQIDFLTRIARDEYGGVTPSNNSWLYMTHMFEEFGLGVKKCLITDVNFRMLNPENTAVNFPLAIVEPNIEIHINAPAIAIVKNSVDDTVSHAVALTGSLGSLLDFKQVVQTYNELAVDFEF